MARKQIEPSQIVPRRSPSTPGRRSPNYPDLNLQAIGQALGITPIYVGRILNGISQPSMAVGQKLAALMGWSLDQVNALYEAKHPINPLNNEECSKTRPSRRKKPEHAKSRNRNQP